MTQKAYSQGSAFPPTKPGVLRIYSMRFCPYAQRTRLVLLHKNIPHETININLKSKPDWFLELNPLGQVPVLQIDDKIVPESTATCDWLDDVYPANRITPVDPYQRAWDRVLTEYISKVEDTLLLWFLLFDGEIQFYTQCNIVTFRLIILCCFGSQPCSFDFLLWPMYERLPVIAVMKENSAAAIDVKDFPAMTSWAKAMKELPAVKATAFDADQHAAFVTTFAKGTPDYDLYLEE
ncbi:glutathione S-transferase omega-1 [Elysia marginata]|uniref:Glutathione S-transferase omega n=1 Tax=Elysia marginata TaxID=1093978 RepID=A0AAV4FC43_9GAST|nr:glutathione S-transferase omega-1 [Elysia marginata]